MKATKQAEFTKSDLGCVLDYSCQSADDLNLETCKFAEGKGWDCGELIAELESKEQDEDYGQNLSELADDAVNWLNEQNNLPFCSWFFEDNSLFYTPSVECAKEDVEFVSSKQNEYPPEGFEGEWLHINDHGNCTLYVREQDGKDREIWAIV